MWGGGCWSGGQYSCGPNGSIGNAAPTDSGDEIYMHHDLCYEARSKNASKQDTALCDQQMVRELKKLSDNSKNWPHPPKPGTEGDAERYRNRAILIFGTLRQ